MIRPTVAAYLVSQLISAGVQRVYGVVGDSLNAFVNEIRTHPEIQWIGVRHKEAGAFAAGAEAQLTGRLAVCAGSCGPGHVHLVNGLYDCHASRAPVLAIAAHIPSSEIGTGYFQETHPERLFADCSHFCEILANPAQMPHCVQLGLPFLLLFPCSSSWLCVRFPPDMAHKGTKEAADRQQTCPTS